MTCRIEHKLQFPSCLLLVVQIIIFNNLVTGLRIVAPASTEAEYAVGTEIESPVYESYVGTYNDFFFENVTVQFPNETFFSKCDLSEVPTATAEILFYRDSNCFPEKVSQLAFEKGFLGVITNTVFNRPGHTALSNWGSNTAPIPVLQVGRKIDVSKLGRIDFYATENMFQQPVYVGLFGTISSFFLLFFLVKIILAGLVLMHSWRERTLHVKNVALIVAFFDLFFSIAGAIDNVDPGGYFHLTSVPLKSIVTSINFQAFMLIDFNLGLHMRISLSEAVSNQGLSKFYIGAAAFIYISTSIVDIFAAHLNFVAFQSTLVFFMRGVFYTITVTITGLYFFQAKRKVIRIVSQANPSTKEARSKLKFSFFSLHASSIFMFAFLLGLLTSIVLFLFGLSISPSQLLGTLSLTIASLLQLISVLPREVYQPVTMMLSSGRSGSQPGSKTSKP